MGRTLPTQVQLLQQEESAWKEFRRALRKEDQEAFDQLWSYARRHVAACSMACRALPFEAHLFSMAVALQRELQELKQFISTQQAGGSPRRITVGEPE